MHIANHDIAGMRSRRASTRESEPMTQSLVSVLEHLLGESLRLRELYRSARRQSGGSALRQLWDVFDSHYQEQLRVIDVLIDRVRTLGGASRVFAGDLLRTAPFSCALQGRHGRARMLQALLDAHESILSDSRPGGSSAETREGGWSLDFAVGQVILANEQQMQTLGKLFLAGGDRAGAMAPLALIED
jgi:starvation-inducible DNA-binding protein